MGRMSREKGKRGEREAARFLCDHGIPASRGVQYRGGPKSQDLAHDLDGFHFEVKFTEAFRLYAALEQAKTDAKDGDIPVVLHRAKSRPWVAVLDGADFLSLVRATTPVRADSPVYGSPRLKEVIVDSALKGEISQQEAEEMIVEYGLKEV